MLKSYIIVGAGWAGQTIASTILKKTSSKIIGFIDDLYSTQEVVSSEKPEIKSIPILGHSKDVSQIAKQYGAEAVVIAITHDREDHLLKQIVECYEKDIPVIEMPDLYEALNQKIPVQHIKQRWIAPKLTKPPHNLYTFFHDATNYLLSLTGLVTVLLPLLPIFALTIKLDSKGPIFYKQRRTGKKGQPFNLLKFRTMCQDADQKGGAWTLKNDYRITRVGRFLRKFRLDELPQLINVLKGDMALIGPRPEASDLVENFKKEIPFYEYRYLVRPGISGWAQVNYENTCSVEGALEKLQYDLYWIKNRSFWLDLKIIFKSIKVMITGFGAV